LNLLEKIDTNERDRVENALELSQMLAEIRHIEQEIETTKNLMELGVIYAPIPGLVVYKEVRYTGAGGTAIEKARVGMERVYYSYPVMELPDLSNMIIEMGLNEYQVGKIKQGHEVIMTLEYDERVLFGSVSKIAVIATREYIDMFTSPEFRNVYKVEVTITNKLQENGDETVKEDQLMPGMVASCRIITDRMENVLYIPLQSIFGEEEDKYVYVKDGDSFKKQIISTGISNGNFSVINEGLDEGRLVALRDPFSELAKVGKDITKTDAGTESKENK